MHVSEVQYHRNGVSGEGFYAVRFEATVDGERTKMLAVVFAPNRDEDGESDWGVYERGGWDNPRVAVFDEALLPDVTFGTNSWRGDKYAPALYKAIMEYRNA